MADTTHAQGPDGNAGPLPADVGGWLARRLNVHPGPLALVPVPGGHTNRLWRGETPSGAVYVKLYVPALTSRLFPNLPGAEARALILLAPTGLAPRPLAAGRTGAGRVLCVAAAPGEPPTRGDAPDAARAVAATLARLHGLPLRATFRHVSTRPYALARGIMADLGTAPEHPVAARLQAIAQRHAATPGPAGPTVLLHGDPVPGNTLLDGAGCVTLIDWQCPALGDPVHDLAIALSPGMRHLYGATPWIPAARAAFWDTYGDPATQARHAALAPLLSARIAAHFLAQAARGRPGYAAAAEIELAALEE